MSTIRLLPPAFLRLLPATTLKRSHIYMSSPALHLQTSISHDVSVRAAVIHVCSILGYEHGLLFHLHCHYDLADVAFHVHLPRLCAGVCIASHSISKANESVLVCSRS